MIAVLWAVAMASNDPGAPPPRPVVTAEWTRAPTSADVIDYYPDIAWRRNLSGRATLSCLIDADGDLTHCQVVSEHPRRVGFGAAALKLAPKFQLAPAHGSHSLAGGHLQVPIDF